MIRQAVLSLLLASVTCVYAEAEVEILLDQPVRIATSSSDVIFPNSWRGGKVQAQGIALPVERRETILRTMVAALNKYPAEVLRQNLRNLYLLEDLRYRGIAASGTNSRQDLYLKAGKESQGFTMAHLERTFHAEFSSILMRNRQELLDTAAWQAANPSGFSYLGDGVDAVKLGKAKTALDAKLHDQGFFSQYAQSTLENDFNGFSQRLWTGDADLWRLVAKHPALRHKLEVAVRFYQRLHPDLDESFFHSLADHKK